MLTTTLALLLAKVTGILVVTLLVTLALGRASAGVRHRLWLVSIAVVLAAPAIGFLAPVRLALLPSAPTRTTHALPSLMNELASVDAAVPSPSVDRTETAPTQTRSATHEPPRWSLSPLATSAMVWAVVALVILALLFRAELAVRGIERRAATLASPDWTSTLYEICDRLGVAEPPRLARSAEVRMPFAWGLVRAVVVLPNDCESWSADRRRAVLLHELAHVKRRDLVGHGLSRLASALWWFHPLVWTAAKRLRVESERACDDLAIVHGAVAADYAEHLLDIVTSVRNTRMPVAALAMARPSEFEGRMLAILNPDCARGERHRSRAIAATAVVGLLALSVAAISPERRPAPVSPATHGPSRQTTITRTQSTMARQFMTQRIMSTNRVELSTPTPRPSVEAASAPSSRVAAVQAAADTGESRASLLAGVLRSDTSANLRKVAAWGLAEFAEQPVAAQALVAALRGDKAPEVREMAAWALSNARDGGDAEQALVNALQHDADQRVRATSAWALGDLGDKRAEAALVAALSDANPDVKQRAAWALGNLGIDKAPKELIALLGDADPRVRRLAAWGLYNIEDDSAIPALQAALKNEKDSQLQLAYIRALAAHGDKSVDALSALVQSPDPRVRDVAVRALAGGHATGPWPWPWPQPRPYP